MKKVPCEVFSRIVGYFRPIKNWNDGKKAEFHDRLTFDENISMKHEMKNKILESVKKQEVLVETR